MSIIKLPFSTSGVVACSLCQSPIDPKHATYGPLNVFCQPTVVCEDHLQETDQLVLLLTDYTIKERRKCGPHKTLHPDHLEWEA